MSDTEQERNDKAYTVGKHHQSVIEFRPNHATDALRRLPHCVKGQILILVNAKVLAQKTQPRLKDFGSRVLVGNAKHDDCHTDEIIPKR